MTFFELILLAIGVSLDAFSVSICKGLAVPKIRARHGLIVGAYFGGFQGLMPGMGFLPAGLVGGFILILIGVRVFISHIIKGI